jgi:hypothetical protein
MSAEKPDALDRKYYEAVAPQSLAERVMMRARDNVYEDFLRVCRPEPDETIVDVGVSDVQTAAANGLERRYPHPERITAVGLGVAEEFRAAFPAITYRRVPPGETLPFDDGHFDIATSNAVVEHVGSESEQRRFVRDLMRVGRRGFVIVPNRMFPIEHHTAIPLLHWTDATFALACRLTGKTEWSRHENLILMSRRRLQRVCPEAVPVRIGTTGLGLGPFSSNLYLYWDNRQPRGESQRALHRE